MLPKIDIVIVTYRSADRALACLESLRDGGLDGLHPECEVVVVDSGSGDGTADTVAAAHRWVRVIALEDNVGFATGCNRGIGVTHSPAVLLLNPDSVVPKGGLRPLVDYLEAHPEVGAVGPALIDEQGRPQVTAQRFPTLSTELSRQWEHLARLTGRFIKDAEPPTEAGPVDWVSGAALLMRRETIDRVGPLDQGYFLYFEETDWCHRASAAGWEIHMMPEVELVHVGGVSAEAADGAVQNGQLAAAWTASRKRYFTHHHGAITANTVEALHGARRLASRFLRGGRK